MVKSTVLLVGAWLGLLAGLARAGHPPLPLEPSEAEVCFWDFRSEAPVGKSETDLDSSRFCRYAVDKQAFLKLLSPRPVSEGYMPGYVRAKIILAPDDVYFVDNSGIVRHGNDKFAVDKIAFSDALKELKKPESPQKEKRCPYAGSKRRAAVSS